MPKPNWTTKATTQKWAEEQLEVLAILKEAWASTAYNPKIDYHYITFDIRNEEDFKKVDKWLHPIIGEVKENDKSK